MALKWSDLDFAIQVCFAEAWEAYCAGSIPIGAAVLDAEGRLLSRGRNRIDEDQAPPGLVYGQQLAHAELNALVVLRETREVLHGCTLYTLVEPCPLCLGAIYMSSVRRVVYACRDAYAGSVNLLGTTAYLSLKPVTVEYLGQSELEVMIQGMTMEHHFQSGMPKAGRYFETQMQSCPKGVKLAIYVEEKRILTELKLRKAPVDAVFARLGSESEGMNYG